MAQKRPRIERESKTVAAMIRLYCRRHHGKELCPQCAALIDYTLKRLDKCPFQEGKTTCAKCPVHCFKPDMRQQIRVVMRYSGPRMLLRHPLMTARHVMDGRRKQPLKNTEKKQ